MEKRHITLFTAIAAAAALAPTAQAGTLVEHSRNGGVYSTTELNTAGGYAVGVLDTSDSLYHTPILKVVSVKPMVCGRGYPDGGG